MPGRRKATITQKTRRGSGLGTTQFSRMTQFMHRNVTSRQCEAPDLVVVLVCMPHMAGQIVEGGAQIVGEGFPAARIAGDVGEALAFAGHCLDEAIVALAEQQAGAVQFPGHAQPRGDGIAQPAVDAQDGEVDRGDGAAGLLPELAEVVGGAFLGEAQHLAGVEPLDRRLADVDGGDGEARVGCVAVVVAAPQRVLDGCPGRARRWRGMLAFACGGSCRHLRKQPGIVGHAAARHLGISCV